MKSIITTLGIKSFLLFPMIYLISCTSPNQNSGDTLVHNKVDTVTISMMKFNPQVLFVHKGDTVLWINNGLVAHTVKSYQDGKFYSDTLEPGKSWTWIVQDSAGYFCTIHPVTMMGKLVIQK
ncbi:MAG: plastocyanin/azurin family copper-binding protein [Chitinophagaceae bacterium]